MIEPVERVREALCFIPADDRDIWIKVAMALRNGGFDYDLLDEWSQNGSNYNPDENLRQWESLTADGGITINSLLTSCSAFFLSPLDVLIS